MKRDFKKSIQATVTKYCDTCNRLFLKIITIFLQKE